MPRNYRTNRTAFLVIAVAVLLILIAVFWPQSGFPQEAVVTPEAVAVVPKGTEIIIPWGTYVSELASLIASFAFAAIVFGLRRLPGQAVAIMQTLRAEQLLQKAIDYGVNATAGAVKDKTLSVTVANEVIAKAMRYAVDNGAPKIVAWMDGADGIGQKLIARLKIEPAAEHDDGDRTNALTVDSRKIPAEVVPSSIVRPPTGTL